MLLVPSHRNHPAGIEATDPDHITITPVGRIFDRLLLTKAVVATWVLLTPLLAVGAVTTPAKDDVPLTLSAAKVPKEVMLGCAAVAKVPVIDPDTDKLDRVPTLVMLGCAAVARMPVIEPDTERADSVPTLVMLGCAAVATVPMRLPPGVPTVVAVTVPANKVLVTVRLAKVPISVMLGCALALRVPLRIPAVTVPAVTVPEQFSAVKVPTAVILGWLAVITVPAATARAGTRFSRYVKFSSNSLSGMVPVCVPKV